jgi:hypothetical protein
MVDAFKSGREWLGTWAVELLEQKGHAVGDPVCWNGIVKTDIDGIPRVPAEAIRMAAQYPEWRDRERGHLEYLRSLTSDANSLLTG